MSAGRLERWELALALAAAVLAILVALPSLSNGFAYDDHIIVRLNPRVTEPHPFWWHLQHGYWPSLAYRPLTVWLFSQEWRIAGGAPWVFHGTNVLLLGGVTALVYRLARTFLPRIPAFAAATLFAVHPVHVEAVANIVGQSELLAALGVLAAVVLFLESGAEGPGRPRRFLIALAATGGALAKENAFVVPGLLLLAGLVAPPQRSARERLRAVGPTLLLSTAAVVGVVVWRAAVLGDAVGVEPALPLVGLSLGERIMTMLGVVPPMARLLLWPARLQTEYGPPVFDAVRELAGPQFKGLLILCAATSVAWTCRQRAPVVTFGLAWAALALIPVSNILVVTGILLAERTLFLPSIGVVVAVAGAGALLVERVRQPVVRYGAAVAVLVVVALGAWRSATRAPVWRDNQTLFTTGVLDAPHSYRAWRMLGLHMHGEGRWDAAEAALRRSLAEWSHDPSVHEGLGLTLVQAGHCDQAVPVLRRGLELDSVRPFGRARLYFCQVKLGDWANARLTAQGGVAVGDSSFAPLLRRADSALADRTPGRRTELPSQ